MRCLLPARHLNSLLQPLWGPMRGADDCSVVVGG